MKSNNLLLICDVLFRFLPYILDTGIQIWNAVEIDRLARSTCETTIWEGGQSRNKTLSMRNSYFCDINFLALGCFIYKPPICCSPPPPPLEEQFRKKRAINDDIYEQEFRFSIKISTEGLMSLIFVQLPGISLGLLGILKAFMNHGLTKDAAVDSLR